MTCRLALVAFATCLLAPAVSAQESPDPASADPVQAARDIPIIVTAPREKDEVAVRSSSRIATKPLFTKENIRSETGVAGLTPGSGATPLALENPMVRKRIVTCTGTSDGADLSERAACLIVQAQGDVAAGSISGAADIYRYMASSPDFTPAERLAGGNLLYGLGEQNSDDAMREEALIRMLEAESLQGMEATSARRTLVAMALKRQDSALAIQRLEEVVDRSPGDSQSLANLAILLRQENQAGAEQRMEQAITARESKGGHVPKGWRDFLRTQG